MVGRFQVMALLQAARAKVLGHPLDEAQSFGLNRAIFYAAAKRGFKGGPSANRPGEQRTLKATPSKSITKTIQEDTIGNENAYYVEIDGKKRYVMGDEILEPKDFKRPEHHRFSKPSPNTLQH